MGYLCNGSDGWTGPQAWLSLSFVSWVEKGPHSGITVTTAWNTVVTGDI